MTDLQPTSIGVLICDDNDAMRAMLCVLVEVAPGLHVAGEARDGLEAVSEAGRLQPDVVLLDLSMPRETGLDALPKIKLISPSSRVIVLSGFSARAMADDVIARGADRYLEKGLRPGEIAAAIREVATSRSARSEA